MNLCETWMLTGSCRWHQNLICHTICWFMCRCLSGSLHPAVTQKAVSRLNSDEYVENKWVVWLQSSRRYLVLWLLLKIKLLLLLYRLLLCLFYSFLYCSGILSWRLWVYAWFYLVCSVIFFGFERFFAQLMLFLNWYIWLDLIEKKVWGRLKWPQCRKMEKKITQMVGGLLAFLLSIFADPFFIALSWFPPGITILLYFFIHAFLVF